jgi:hypothetical protein
MRFAPTISRNGRRTRERGSMLLTAMLFAIGIAIVLGSYLNLSRTALKVSHRTFFSNDAANLAEAGVEEALYSFNLMATGTAPATAWTGWTLAGSNATRTLPTFNRDQNGVGVVKVYVSGYDGSDASPSIISQAVVTPFDGGAPIVRTVQVMLRQYAGTRGHGLVVLNGALTMANATIADSYASNPSGSPTGPWAVYSTAIDAANASVVVLAGTVSIASGQVKGNLYLGSSVASPPNSDYTGTITKPYTATFPFPAFPAATELSQSYNLGAVIPAVLPRGGDLPAADGRYYYFCASATLRSFSVTAGTNVTIVGTSAVSMPLTSTTEITLPTSSTLHVYMTGAFTMGTGTDFNTSGYAGALRIYTNTTTNCTVANDCRFVGWFHAPNATFSASGTNTANRLSGCFIAKSIVTASAQHFHYDESLPTYATYEMTRYLDLQSAADRATVSGLTGGFLR